MDYAILPSERKLTRYSLCSNAGRRSVGMMGFGAAPSVLAVCRIEGAQSDLHYYNTAFSGGAGLHTPPQTPETLPLNNDLTTLTAFEVLAALFPNSAAAQAALPYAKALRITSQASTWDGVVLSLPGQERTLYVIGRGAEALMLRESVTALLDLADEHLECTAFVIALEKNTPGLGELVHALTYLSGQIVTRPPFVANPSHVLVGIEL
ncbi:hypothetical protein FRC10_011765 [Ceratobasidium sp. 414]|nr:hypothetical protein FRC10_011765 [Ceratobasidium sp. 414]